ncbi:hypothetical protein AC1031_016792 [Aphanomyces cochlioides]|nr:hypothetical protein AC1031_016792 [Aphanomyces cochlioides]
MSYEDRRREAARTGMAKLRAARKKEMDVLTSQEQSLQVALAYLKAHPEEQYQSIQPFAYARRVLHQHHDDALREQLVTRNRLIQSGRTAKKKRIDDYKAVVLAAQAHILRTKRINLELLTRLTGRLQLKVFLHDWLASQSPQKKYPPRKTYEEEVEDFLDVNIHLDEDDCGTCVYAIESHTWWFDLVESNPLVESSVLERFEDHIMYLKHEFTRYKFRSLYVAGVFLDHDEDRITITQTGIAIDEHFPFVQGESRSNGFQWVVFQHVTDRLTIVRWTIVNFCPVNANGPLSLLETALNSYCAARPEDSEEVLLAKFQTAAEKYLEGARDQFLRRCSRFKLEPTTIPARDLPIGSVSRTKTA